MKKNDKKQDGLIDEFLKNEDEGKIGKKEKEKMRLE